MTKKKKPVRRRSSRRPIVPIRVVPTRPHQRRARERFKAALVGAPPELPKLAPLAVPVIPDWANRVQDEIAQTIGPAKLPHVIDPELVVLDECRRKLEAELRPEARVRVARYLLARFVDLPGGGL